MSMVKPAYFGEREYFPHFRRLHGPAIWRILSKRKVSSRAVVMIKVGNHMAPKRDLIQDDDMVEAFSANRADQPFDVRALLRRSESGENFADFQTFDLRPEGGTIDAVTVSEQVPRRLIPRECL